ncbi:hypothetical protein [Bdellovibrio bacteriovorus]|uniref:hypothetical protein n=1 Tax=Bdellovibrio bacteriovorus TaxID=959 RepID=UPI0035A70CBE
MNGRIEVHATAGHGAQAESYAKTLTEIERLIAPLAIPKETNVQVGTAFRLSSFNAEDFNIYVGLRPDRMGKIHPKSSLTTLAHEYGHAIFEKNLMKDLESYKSIRQEALTLETRVEKAVEEAKSLAYRHSVTFNKEKKALLQTQAIDKALEAKSLGDQVKSLRGYWSIRGAHHELFADVIALVATKDPHAVRDVLIDKSEKLKEHSSSLIGLRDFTDGRHHLNRKTWEKEHPLFTGLFGDIYYAFLPARWELWNLTKNKIKSENYRKELPLKVFQILEKNLSESFAKDPADIGTNGFKDIKRMNEQLIEDFRREL